MVNQEPDGPSGPVGPTGGGSVTNPNTLPSTFYTPDTHADIQSYGDLDYAQTIFEYDEFGNLTRVILPEGSDSTRVYYEYIYEEARRELPLWRRERRPPRQGARGPPPLMASISTTVRADATLTRWAR